MADNFDLRQFLTENKLTKNAQLLNEARVEGFDVNKKAFKVSFINKYGGEGDFRILNAETPEQAEEVFTNIFVKNPDMVKSIKSIEPYQVPAPKPQAQSQPGLEGVDYGSIEIDGVDSNDYPDFVDAYVAYAEFEDGTPLSEEELYQLTDELYQSGELADRAAESLYEGKEGEEESGKKSEEYFRNEDDFVVFPLDVSKTQYVKGGRWQEKKKPVNKVNEAKSYKVSKNSKEAQHLKKGDIIGSGDEVVSVSAGAKTPSGKVEVTLKTKDGKTKTSTWGKTTKVGVKEKETVKENRMTQRDRYLTRLVENALGLTEGRTERSGDPLANRPVGGIRNDQEGYKDMMTGRADNAPFSHTDSNDLRNRYTNQGAGEKPRLPEGDEMVEEKPLPKYENIEKLMQEIDKNTDEEAHKFKVQEMKRVADMLEKKCTALEEGDDADHIDQKKLKQMKKDIMTLRKGMEKLEKLGEKKFAKKETKAELKEGFDLRKFLVENKLTRDSRMLSEGEQYLDGSWNSDNYKDLVKKIEDIFNKGGRGASFTYSGKDFTITKKGERYLITSSTDWEFEALSVESAIKQAHAFTNK